MPTILLKADYNDADYVYKLTDITEDELQLIKPIIRSIKDFKSYSNNSHITFHHNFPTEDLCRKDLGEKSVEELYGSFEGFNIFNKLIPYVEDWGIHTINEILLIDIKEKLM